ncbi:SDR family oxidoreductase [Citricoccus nitrophenolicus]|uniref:SDR family oxidoreductase n=1 Tax=Citricoccus nitrophenolicus TaxID=863575 RepID=A0ABV0IGQ3_9MICC
MSEFEGTTIAITGSAQGIGQEMAERFAGLGANIVLSDVNGERLKATEDGIRRSSDAVTSIQTDVTNPDDCSAMVDHAVSTFGRLDVMVCNAGVVQVKPFLEIAPEEWDLTFDVNVKGTFLTMQAAARQMLAQDALTDGRPSGKIINMGSIAGRYASGPMAPIIPHYRASKAAVINLTHAASFTFAPKITVNAICPGLVETDMWKKIDAEWSAVEGWETGTAWKTRTAAVPLGRPQSSADVANLAQFLASPGSDYMTGQAINVDGGLTMG